MEIGDIWLFIGAWIVGAILYYLLRKKYKRWW